MLGVLEVPVTTAALGEDAMIPRVLTVRANRASPGNIELTCSTIAGNVAATLQWPDDDPVDDLAEAIVAAVKSSGFTGLKEPLGVWNVRLLKPDANPLAPNEYSPSLLAQFGLEGRPQKRQKTER